MACGHSGQKLGAGATARRAARRDIPAAASSGLAVRQRPAWCRRPEPPRLPAVRRDIPAAARRWRATRRLTGLASPLPQAPALPRWFRLQASFPPQARVPRQEASRRMGQAPRRWGGLLCRRRRLGRWGRFLSGHLGACAVDRGLRRLQRKPAPAEEPLPPPEWPAREGPNLDWPQPEYPSGPPEARQRPPRPPAGEPPDPNWPQPESPSEAPAGRSDRRSAFTPYPSQGRSTAER